MENHETRLGYKPGRDPKGAFRFLILFLFFALLMPGPSFGAQKKEVKKQPPQKEAVQKETAMTDSNVQTSFKKAEDLLKKGDIDGSQRIFIKVYDYTKEALATMTFIQGQYEKVVNDPSTNQTEKEDMFIKLQRVRQVTSKYNIIKSAAAYDLGYIYT